MDSCANSDSEQYEEYRSCAELVLLCLYETDLPETNYCLSV